LVFAGGCGRHLQAVQNPAQAIHLAGQGLDLAFQFRLGVSQRGLIALHSHELPVESFDLGQLLGLSIAGHISAHAPEQLRGQKLFCDPDAIADQRVFFGVRAQFQIAAVMVDGCGVILPVIVQQQRQLQMCGSHAGMIEQNLSVEADGLIQFSGLFAGDRLAKQRVLPLFPLQVSVVRTACCNKQGHAAEESAHP